jgi:hypothetical protein
VMGQIKCTTERRERDIQGKAQRNKTAVLLVGLHSDFYGRGSCTNNVCGPLVPTLYTQLHVANHIILRFITGRNKKNDLAGIISTSFPWLSDECHLLTWTSTISNLP